MLDRRELLQLSLGMAGMALAGHSGAISATLPSLAIAALLPAMPQAEPLDWRERADAFNGYVMNPANRVLQKHPDGSHYFASALEGVGDGGLTTFAPILLGKILRGDEVEWLAPSMAAYFSNEHGIFLDGRSASSCEYWYLMNVNALAAGVVRKFLATNHDFTDRVRSSADRLISMAHQIGYDFNSQGYRFDTCAPWTKQDIYRQPDAIGGYAYLMLLAHQMFGDANYLAEGREAIGRYLSFAANPWYEVPSGAMACLAAARLSVRDRNVDLGRALSFVFDPGGHPLHTGQWGGAEVNGLMAGFRTEPMGEAYSMESLMAVGYLLPVLRYRPEFATLIGNYVLNVAANARSFYADCLPPENQSRPELTSAIPYERLTRALNSKSPYASGDYGSHRSIYGGAYALWLGECLKSTNEMRILQMNVSATDFLEPATYPTYLYYNPWSEAKRVRRPALGEGSRLYDLGAHAFLNRGTGSLEIPARGSRLIVVVPAAALPRLRSGTLFCGGTAVDYAPGGAEASMPN